MLYTHTTSYLVYTRPVQSAQLQKLNLPFLDCCCLKFFFFSVFLVIKKKINRNCNSYLALLFVVDKLFETLRAGHNSKHHNDVILEKIEAEHPNLS